MSARTKNGSLTCRDCGRIKRVPWTVMDELGGAFTCDVCEHDLHPEHELNNDDAPIVTV